MRWSGNETISSAIGHRYVTVRIRIMAAEFTAFEKHYSDLSTVVTKPDILATELCAAGVIGKLAYDGLSTSGSPKLDKTSKLLASVISQIQINPQIFHEFVGVLGKCDDQALQSAANKIQETYQQLQDEYNNILSKESVLPGDSLNAYISFTSVDTPFARKIYHCLTRNSGYKIPVFAPMEELHSHAIWDAAEIIGSSKKTILVLSPAYLESEWGSDESKLAVSVPPVGLSVIPVVYHPCIIPAYLRPLFSLDYQRAHNNQEMETHFWKKLAYMVSATLEEILLYSFVHIVEMTQGYAVEKTVVELNTLDSYQRHVFLSASDMELDFAEDIHMRLTQSSFRVFLPSTDVIPGQYWVEEVANEIEQSSKVILVLSPEYLKTDWCLYEARLALHAARIRGIVGFIVLVLYQDCEVPIWMQDVCHGVIRYSEAPATEGFWDKLYGALEGFSSIDLHWSPELEAFQMHKSQLVECLLDPVSSIKDLLTSGIISSQVCETILTSEMCSRGETANIVAAEIQGRLVTCPSPFHFLVDLINKQPNLQFLAAKMRQSCVKLTSGVLNGISYISSMLSDQIDSKGGRIDWDEYGIVVTVPPGAVPEVAYLQLMLGCSVSISCILPERFELVSPVYLVLPTFHFQKEVEISIQHWVNIKEHESLMFVSAPIVPQVAKENPWKTAPQSSRYKPKYHFKCLQEIKTEITADRAKVFLKHFCLLAVARGFTILGQGLSSTASADTCYQYNAVLCRPIECKAQTTWTAVFSITVRSKGFEQALREQLERQYGLRYRTSSRSICFKEAMISLDIPYEDARSQGYRIVPDQRPCQLSKAVVDYALQHHDCTPVIDDAYPPRVYLDVSQLEPIAATVSHSCLDCQLRLDGTAEEVQFHLTSPLVVHSPDAQSGFSRKRTTCQDGKLRIENLLEISIYLNSLSREQVFNLGLVLGLTFITLEHIKSSSSFLNEMLAAWLQERDQVGKPSFGSPSWMTLVNALRHPRITQTGIADRITCERDIL